MTVIHIIAKSQLEGKSHGTHDFFVFFFQKTQEKIIFTNLSWVYIYLGRIEI